MSKTPLVPDHIKQMRALLLGFKNEIAGLPNKGIGASEQQSAEQCQALYYFCMCIGEYLPEAYRTGHEPNFRKLLVESADTTMQPLTDMAVSIRKDGVPLGEMLQYLLRLFRLVHKELYPNSTLLKTTESQQIESGSITSDTIINPQHLELVDSIVIPFKRSFPRITQFMGWTLSEQMTADMCQVLVYTPLGIEQHLPNEVKWLIADFQDVAEDEIDQAHRTLNFISDSMLKRGADEEEIIPYMLHAFQQSYSRNFPNSRFLPLV